jgi:hypothetical protein
MNLGDGTIGQLNRLICGHYMHLFTYRVECFYFLPSSCFFFRSEQSKLQRIIAHALQMRSLQF